MDGEQNCLHRHILRQYEDSLIVIPNHKLVNSLFFLFYLAKNGDSDYFESLMSFVEHHVHILCWNNFHQKLAILIWLQNSGYHRVFRTGLRQGLLVFGEGKEGGEGEGGEVRGERDGGKEKS